MYVCWSIFFAIFVISINILSFEKIQQTENKKEMKITVQVDQIRASEELFVFKFK